jgi:ABC-type transport system involved in multi-copper enzyme maturation permease subunit
VLLAIRRSTTGPLERSFGAVVLYALVPEAVCMLGLLMTMCPAVADELERGTWVHVATRPGGRRALVLGTFIAAVTWTTAVGLGAVLLAVLAGGMTDPWGLIAMFAALVVLSCVGRAALFALPAVVLPSRALVASVGVAVVVEYLAGFLPAVINQATVSLRLRSLLVHWMGWRQRMPPQLRLIVDPQPVWVQCAAVVVLAIVFLTVAIMILERRQFPPSEEG